MLYAALGDSITYGYNSTSEDRTYVTHIKNALSKQQPVNLFVHAKPGWTSQQLLKSLPKVPECIWAEASLITILVGGNDLLRSTPWLISGNPAKMMQVADNLNRNLADMLNMVRRKGIVILGTVYNPFPSSYIVQEYITRMNQVIHTTAKREGILVADVASAMKKREAECIDGYKQGDLRDFRLFSNPIHPNDKGHELIARVFLKACQSHLMKDRTKVQKRRTAVKR